MGAIVDGGVGVLDEARQQADEHGSGLGLGELLGEDGDGCGRSDLAEVEASDAVGDGKEIAMGAGLLARVRDERSHRILIIGANFSEIACLAELNFQHGLGRLGELPGGCPKGCFQ